MLSIDKSQWLIENIEKDLVSTTLIKEMDVICNQRFPYSLTKIIHILIMAILTKEIFRFLCNPCQNSYGVFKENRTNVPEI